MPHSCGTKKTIFIFSNSYNHLFLFKSLEENALVLVVYSGLKENGGNTDKGLWYSNF
jgi:hypothetical protein